MRRHAWPQIPNVQQVSHLNLRKSEKNFTKPVQPLDPSASDLQNLKTSGPKVQPRAATRPHAKPQTRDDQRLSPSKLCISVYDFTKLTIHGSFTALELQSPKISGPKTLQRAYTRRHKSWRSQPQIHAPTLATFIMLHAPTRRDLTCA